jgi:hypothetical protein
MVILFGIDVIPLGAVSAVLVLMQSTVVGSWCFLCLCSAAISLILIYYAYDEVWSSVTYLRRVWRHTGSRRDVWNVFWGRYSARAEEALATGRAQYVVRHRAQRSDATAAARGASSGSRRLRTVVVAPMASRPRTVRYLVSRRVLRDAVELQWTIEVVEEDFAASRQAMC